MTAFSAIYRSGIDSDQHARLVEWLLRGMWQPIASAPFDRDLELAVLDREGPHALVFACRRILSGWINAQTRERIDVRPTHWREWDAKN